MCTSEILSRLTTIEDLLKKLISFSNTEINKPITFKEACAYLGYAPSYLYKLTYKNVIPHYKPTGKMIFFSKSELDEWIFKGDLTQALSLKKGEGELQKDPNQVDMFDTSATISVNPGNEKEVIIEFPLKSRRKK